MNAVALSWRNSLKWVGPGMLMAGAAIGVSHLVQSTRAGAEYGFALIPLVVVVNLLKYPFFEYGHRYPAATGENLLQGYLRLGTPYLVFYLLLNLVTAFGSMAAVSFVTAALAKSLTGGSGSLIAWTSGVMTITVLFLIMGHYRALDKLMKLIMATLFIATVVATIAAFMRGPVAPAGFFGPSPWTAAALPFLIALMGWMPAPFEMSVWQSLWCQAKSREMKGRMGLKEAKFDFNLGYFLCIFLAALFVSLGALVMHGSGQSFSDSGAVFASQVVTLYSTSIGTWATPVIAIAAFTTMFSTTLTVVDAYPRSLAAGMLLLFPMKISERLLHWIWMAAGCTLALLFIAFMGSSLKTLVDVVTIISFLTAAPFAYLNHRLLNSEHTPAEYRPGPVLRTLSYVGLFYLLAFAGIYLAL